MLVLLSVRHRFVMESSRSDLLVATGYEGDQACSVAAAIFLRGGGVRVDATDGGGYTALMRAVIGGHFALASMLLQHGADPTMSTKNKSWTALMYAQLYGNWGIADAMRAAAAEKAASGTHTREAVDQLKNDIGLTVAECRTRCGCAPASSDAGLWGTCASTPGMLVRESRKKEGGEEVWTWAGDTTDASAGRRKRAAAPRPPLSQPLNRFKVLMLGDSNAGKAEILSSYANDTFSPTTPFITTIGIDVKIKKVHLALGSDPPVAVKAQIWDTAGQERFRTITSAYLRGANALVLVYNACVPGSLDILRDWISQIVRTESSDATFAVIGTHAGRPNSVVSREEVMVMIAELGLTTLLFEVVRSTVILTRVMMR